MPRLDRSRLAVARPRARRRRGAPSADTTLNLVAYSTPKPVMAKIISGLAGDTGQGEGVDFTQSYGASTNQAKAVARRPARRPRLPLDRATT